MTFPLPKILVLGATGLVGRVVYSYLHKQFPDKVLGTSRTGELFLQLTIENFEKDFLKIIKKYPDISFVINCIGITKSTAVSKEKLFQVNANFPHQLENILKNKSMLIHISTDAVFAKNAGGVSETSDTHPDDEYGKSKLIGEVIAAHSLTIRSSFLGFDPEKRSGLLEWIRTSENKKISGYINQKWAGCTSLQFAQLCSYLIEADHFQTTRQHSPIFHFCPLRATKYKIVTNTVSALKIKKTVLKTTGVEISRHLTSEYKELMPFYKKNHTLIHSLTDLISYESEV